MKVASEKYYSVVALVHPAGPKLLEGRFGALLGLATGRDFRH